MVTLESSDADIYFIACNPLIGIYHNGSLPIGTEVNSGQPCIVHTHDIDTTYDLIYIDYCYDTDDIDCDHINIPRPFVWSVYIDEEDIQEVVDSLNTLDFITVNAIKHPTEDKWAIPFNEKIFNYIPDGDIKTFLYSKSVQSIAEGRRFDTDAMIANNWV
jgi:hypothetical protein